MPRFAALFTSDPTLVQCELSRLGGQVELDDASFILGVGGLPGRAWCCTAGTAWASHVRKGGTCPTPTSSCCTAGTLPVGQPLEDNAQPFRFRSWLFAQVGEVAREERVRERLFEELPDFLQRTIRGTTLAEVVFGVFLTELRALGRTEDPDLEAPRVAARCWRRRRARWRPRRRRSAGAPGPAWRWWPPTGDCSPARGTAASRCPTRCSRGTRSAPRCGLTGAKGEPEGLVRDHLRRRSLRPGHHPGPRGELAHGDRRRLGVGRSHAGGRAHRRASPFSARRSSRRAPAAAGSRWRETAPGRPPSRVRSRIHPNSSAGKKTASRHTSKTARWPSAKSRAVSQNAGPSRAPRKTRPWGQASRSRRLEVAAVEELLGQRDHEELIDDPLREAIGPAKGEVRRRDVGREDVRDVGRQQRPEPREGDVAQDEEREDDRGDAEELQQVGAEAAGGEPVLRRVLAAAPHRPQRQVEEADGGDELGDGVRDEPGERIAPKQTAHSVSASRTGSAGSFASRAASSRSRALGGGLGVGRRGSFRLSSSPGPQIRHPSSSWTTRQA